jgi:phage shock protein PspC (stress-responsive transcriptional regulator)
MRYWQVPSRDNDERLLGGVASGVAAEIGIDPIWIRLAFVLLFAIGGWGAILYLVALGAMSLASYHGYGPTEPPRPKGLSHRHRMLGTGLVVAGLAVLAVGLGGFPPTVVWPVGIIGSGIVLSMRRRSPATQLFGAGLSAVGVFGLVASIDVAPSVSPAVVAAAVVFGISVMSAPWWWRLVRELDGERQARIRSDERADVAAHLHDSVLQTLTLIQKGLNDGTADPQQMAQLARQQERELRNWLDPDRASRSGGSIRGRLDQIAGEVESLHGVTVEVVCVGDVLVDDRIEALLAATREAAMNAARHSGAPRIDLFAEVRPDRIEVFVRDTGKGFDPHAVDDDRRGLRESVTGRIERAGGAAHIHTEIGEGTEVELVLSRQPVSDGFAGKGAAD